LGRYAVEAYARGDEARLTEIVSSAFPVLAVASCLLMGLAGIVAWQAGAVLHIEPHWLNDARMMLLLLATSLAVRVTLIPFGLGFYVQQKFVGLSLLSLGSQAIRLTLLLILLSMSTRILWVALAAAAAEVTTAVAQTVVSRSMVPALRFRPSAFRYSTVRELMGYGIWNAVSQLASLGRTTVQPLILNHFGTPMDVTCFGIGILLAGEIQRLTIIVTGPLQPPLTAMYATGDHVGLQRAYLRGNRYALWAILLVVPPLIIFSREAITLYIGSKYLLAAGVMTCLLAIMPLNYSNIMFSFLAVASARVKEIALRQLCVQSMTLLAAFYMVASLKLGALGSAAAALAVGSISAPLVMWPLGRRISGVSSGDWLRKTVVPGVLPALAGIAVWLPLRYLVHPASWLSLGACVFLGLACYLSVLAIFCLQPHERDDIKHVWRTVRSLPQTWLRRNEVSMEGGEQAPDDLV
jgi:O-antigen/teichoic acid export membrane protein